MRKSTKVNISVHYLNSHHLLSPSFTGSYKYLTVSTFLNSDRVCVVKDQDGSRATVPDPKLAAIQLSR